MEGERKVETALNTPEFGYFWTIVLGLVQGLTEFFPVSSSGHLALLEHLGLGRPAPAGFDVLLHFATLAVVIHYFRFAMLWYAKNDRRVLILAVLATLPAGLIGLAARNFFEELRQSPGMICLGLLVTACALATAEMRASPSRWLRDLNWFEALAIGLCQALALAPGISRSGLSISGAMICGTERGEAFRFSFILSIPVVLGAAGLHLLELIRSDGLSGLWRTVPPGPLLAGLAAAALAGRLALTWLERLATSGRLVWFAGYCCLAALAGLIYFR
jgi:undecaprenyl-diphosphatase